MKTFLTIERLAIVILGALLGCGGSSPAPVGGTGGETMSSTMTSPAAGGQGTGGAPPKTPVSLDAPCAVDGQLGPIQTKDGVVVDGVTLSEDGAIALRCWFVDQATAVDTVEY